MKAVALVSGGMDSPLAAALMSKKMEIIPVHFLTHPFGRTSLDVVFNSFKVLKERIGFKTIILCPWGKALSTIVKNPLKRAYTCLICRRGMLKASEMICESSGAVAIITGESLGQKASQTLRNMAVTSRGIRYPILRPLLGLNKDEIERLSKRLGIWVEKHVGACTAFPKNPVTKGDAKVLKELYNALNMQEIVEECIKNSFKGDVEDVSDLKDFFLESSRKIVESLFSEGIFEA